MIRLTRLRKDGAQLMKLEGNLNAHSVALVGLECRRLAAEAGPKPLRLDLRDLKDADQAGLLLLRDLEADPNIEFVECPSVWLTLIHLLPR